MSKQPALFTKKARMKIYKIALAHFIKSNKRQDDESRFDYWKRQTDGMCRSIDAAVAQMRDQGYAYRPSNRKYLPEYWDFKPNTCWRENSDYWYTLYCKRGGYKKRVSLLTALSEGKTPEAWKKEWKAAGNR